MRSKKLTALQCTKSSIPLPHSKVGINFAMLQSWHDDGIFDNFLNAALADYCRHATIKSQTIVRERFIEKKGKKNRQMSVLGR